MPGQALYPKCERLFSDLEEAEQSVLSLDVMPRGHLRVVCTDVLGEQYVAQGGSGDLRRAFAAQGGRARHHADGGPGGGGLRPRHPLWRCSTTPRSRRARCTSCRTWCAHRRATSRSTARRNPSMSCASTTASSPRSTPARRGTSRWTGRTFRSTCRATGAATAARRSLLLRWKAWGSAGCRSSTCGIS